MFLFRSIYLKVSKEFRSSIVSIYGIGKFKPSHIAARLGLALPIRFSSLNRFMLTILTGFMHESVVDRIKIIRVIKTNISSLIETGHYKGKRQKDHLPCRGQRTRTNASTRKHRGFNQFHK